MTKLIKQINFPSDLRKFKKENLKQISEELRDELIDVVSETLFRIQHQEVEHPQQLEDLVVLEQEEV